MVLSYKETERNPKELRLGRNFAHIAFAWTKFDDRSVADQEDWGRLFNHITKHGITNPLVVFEECVLIGIRRCEIAQIQRIPLVKCWEIQDDITRDITPNRIQELTNLYREAKY